MKETYPYSYELVSLLELSLVSSFYTTFPIPQIPLRLYWHITLVLINLFLTWLDIPSSSSLKYSSYYAYTVIYASPGIPIWLTFWLTRGRLLDAVPLADTLAKGLSWKGEIKLLLKTKQTFV